MGRIIIGVALFMAIVFIIYVRITTPHLKVCDNTRNWDCE